ncbi:MAG: aldehyde dehydrogenase (NADP(+)) [Planctomycetaceae bacterium]
MPHPVLINGEWVASAGTQTFQAVNPATEQTLPGKFPVSPWSDLDKAIAAAVEAAKQMRGWPGYRVAKFLDEYASEIETRTSALVEAAHEETGLPKSPRLQNGELPRTTNQLRQAAEAARSNSWRVPTIDTAAGIRSMLGPIGPVVVFGPNNFPFAFNGISGGDFAAAIAAGNPVIAKGHSSHPETTRIFAEAALAASQKHNMPPGLVQLIYRTGHEDGYKLVSDPRIAASGYTGARHTGLKLKAAADQAGKPFYAELSSINPVFILAGALNERADAIADDFSGSCLMGAGQFCTNPGLVILPAGSAGDAFVGLIAARFESAAPGTMLNEGVRQSFAAGIKALQDAGARLVTGGQPGGGTGVSFRNTLLTVRGSQFLEHPAAFQTEAFGNGSLFVLADNPQQMLAIAESLEGNLTGCLYTSNDGSDDEIYSLIEPALRTKVGRILNDKMPTGVAVSPAMNHGGPFPATAHPNFTAVGIPASIARFSALYCYDNVRPDRLPEVLKDRNPGDVWRCIDGEWTTRNVS